MKKDSPNKEFIIVPSDETCNCNDCPYMKMITMQKIYDVLKNESNEILLDADVIEKSLLPVERMLEISRKNNII